MKKLLLLLLGGVIALNVGAQESTIMGMVSVPGATVTPAQTFSKAQIKAARDKYSYKTTTGGNRWYNYPFYVDTNESVLSTGNSIGTSVAFMWQDSNLVFPYTAGARHINLVSVGAIFDPSAPSFNDSIYYQGEMKVTSSNTYVLDSVDIAGVYRVNPSKTAVVDTLVISYVGNADIPTGGGLTSSHYGTISFDDLRYDSVQNCTRASATTYGTLGTNVTRIPLDMTEWADSTANGIWFRRIGLPSPITVSGGGVAGLSISFRSGDATRPLTVTPGDTIARANNTYKFNNFEPLIASLEDASNNTQWAPFVTGDRNIGYFKELPNFQGGWENAYLPQFAFTAASTSGAFYYQYPEIDWHITCSSCGVITNTSAVKNVSVINKVSAYPNPATNELVIPFTLTQSAQVTVSLTNMLGQAVVSQNLGNVNNGKAVINTSNLPAGVYTYTVSANGERNTGRVVVAH